MLDENQCRVYSNASFDVPYGDFLNSFKEKFTNKIIKGSVLDLGCGPGDLSILFAKTFHQTNIHAIDGSEMMLDLARKKVNQYNLSNRIIFFNQRIPDLDLPCRSYDIILSNWTLHHLINPFHLWEVIKKYSKPDTIIYLMDFTRPRTVKLAKQIIRKHCKNEPEIFKKDCYNSLLASFRPQEIISQMNQCQLSKLNFAIVSKYQFAVWGQF